MPHTIWKGSISFGLVNIPVGLVAAEKTKELSFSLLDRRDLGPVGYRRINKKTGQEVGTREIVKGYEYDPGQYVILNDEDFKRANAKATQVIDIVDFVDVSEIPPVFFEKPYYLEPVGKGKKSYALLRETLRRAGKAGVATVVIHTREYLALVLPWQKALVLNLLRFVDELRPLDDLNLPGESLEELGVGEKELKMAEMLVGSMIEHWHPEKYHDHYREDILSLVRRRIETGEIREVEVVPAPEPAGGEVIDLMALLKQSVEKSEARRKERRSAGG